MSRIRMKVTIQNDSSRTLRLRDAKLTHGDWTPGWDPGKRPVVGPGQTAEFRGEGRAIATPPLFKLTPTTGSEGRVWYDVEGTGGQLYVHFDSPLIESQYGNTFHVWGPDGFEAAHTGGQGHQAHLAITFRDTAVRRVPKFRPSENGLHFGNKGWPAGLPVMTVGRVWNALLRKLGPLGGALRIAPVSDDWLPFTDARQGLCGGMVFTVKDYYDAKLYPPTDTTVPGTASHPLATYIRDRLVDSFDIDGSGSRWLAYSAPTYPDGDEGPSQTAGLARGRAWVTYRDEWPKIREDILAGRPSPIGLIQTTELAIGDNHQNLAYAYRQSGQAVDLWVYDPNFPDADNLILRFNIGDTTGRVHVQRVTDPSQPGSGWGTDAKREIRAILHMEGYGAKLPPFGRTALPPKPAVTLERTRHTITTVSGTTEHEGSTPCGDPLRFGHWVTRSTSDYSAEITGFGGSPVVTWTVGGLSIGGANGSVRPVTDGIPHTVATALDTDARGLRLSSQAGDEVDTTVTVTVRSADGRHSATASAKFEAPGEFDGPNPEDLLAVGGCLKSIIPHLPLDLGDILVGPGSPRPEWQVIETALERVTSNEVVLTTEASNAIAQLSGIRTYAREALRANASRLKTDRLDPSRIEEVKVDTVRFGQAKLDEAKLDTGRFGRLNRPG